MTTAKAIRADTPSTSSQLSLFQNEGQALLDALRNNLNLLGELALRYGVETQPERSDDPPSITTPGDVHKLLEPEMSGLAQEQLRVLLLNTKNVVLGQRVVYQGNVSAPRNAA